MHTTDITHTHGSLSIQTCSPFAHSLPFIHYVRICTSFFLVFFVPAEFIQYISTQMTTFRCCSHIEILFRSHIYDSTIEYFTMSEFLLFYSRPWLFRFNSHAAFVSLTSSSSVQHRGINIQNTIQTCVQIVHVQYRWQAREMYVCPCQTICSKAWKWFSHECSCNSRLDVSAYGSSCDTSASKLVHIIQLKLNDFRKHTHVDYF